VRIVKLSNAEIEFATLDGVRRFFLEEMPVGERPGKFRVTRGRITKDGLEPGEPLVFTYEARVVFTAYAGSGLLPNDDDYSKRYPHYFIVDLATLREADEDFYDVERRYNKATGTSLKLVKSQGWSRLPNSAHTEDIWTHLRKGAIRTIVEISQEINRRAETHAIGHLQEIRRELKGLSRLPTREIFSAQTIADDYAFHAGGRTELQFNIGLEVVDDVTHLRHGVAFSLEPSQTLPKITPLIPKIARFNEFLRMYPEEFSDLRMWHYARGTRSSNYVAAPILPELVQPKVFIFLGKLASAAEPNYDLILGDFDRLLPLYRYVEGNATFPSLAESRSEFRFIPGCSIKRSRTTATLTEREIDVQLRHNDLQLALYEYLAKKYGTEAVTTECGNGAGARLDAVVRANGGYRFYEIKTASSARACIREALAQLLEYSFWPGAQEAESMFIVGEPPLDPDADAFLRRLRKRFALPIHYQQFDLQAGRLAE